MAAPLANIVGTAKAGGLRQAMDTGLWRGPWEVGDGYAVDEFVEATVNGQLEILRALQPHTASAENAPTAAGGGAYWVICTGGEKLRAERLKAVAHAIFSEAAAGETRIASLWRGTRAQYDALPEKRNDTAYVTVG